MRTRCLPVRNSSWKVILPLDEITGVFAVESLRGDPAAIDLDVKNPVTLSAPVGCLQNERLVFDGRVEFDEAAGTRVATRMEAIGNGVGNGARQPVASFIGLHAEANHVHRPPVEFCCSRGLRFPQGECGFPFDRGVALEVDGGPPLVQAEERREGEVIWPSGAATPEPRVLVVDHFEGCQ